MICTSTVNGMRGFVMGFVTYVCPSRPSWEEANVEGENSLGCVSAQKCNRIDAVVLLKCTRVTRTLYRYKF